MRKTFIAALAATVVATGFTPVTAAPIPAQGAVRDGLAAGSLVEDVQYRRTYRTDRFGNPVVVERYRGGPYYGDGYYRRRNRGGAAAAGIAGLAARALICGAIASSQAQAQPLPQTADPDFIAYCSRRYRSFDPVSGTFLANDGQRYPCQYP